MFGYGMPLKVVQTMFCGNWGQMLHPLLSWKPSKNVSGMQIMPKGTVHFCQPDAVNQMTRSKYKCIQIFVGFCH